MPRDTPAAFETFVKINPPGTSVGAATMNTPPMPPVNVREVGQQYAPPEVASAQVLKCAALIMVNVSPEGPAAGSGTRVGDVAIGLVVGSP
jgi:hypothetical protein